MKIELTIKRDGGTTIPMPPSEENPSGKTYHFKPEIENGPHLADVEDQAHLTRFMQIPEYRLVKADATTKAAAPEVPPAGAEGEGAVVGEGAAPAAPASETADGAATEPASGIDADDIAASDLTSDAPKSYDEMTDEQLAATYEQKLGRKPHPSSRRETMIASLKAHDDAAE